VTGSTEDGWDGIDEALTYSFDAGAAVNVILVTDEDRDSYNTLLTYAGVLASLQAKDALLNVAVNQSFTKASSPVALGMDSLGNAYVADGLGGYTKVLGYTTANSTPRRSTSTWPGQRALLPGT